MTGPIVLTEAGNKTIGHYDNNTITQQDGGMEKKAAPPPSSRKRALKQAPPPSHEPAARVDERPLLERRIEEALALADSATTTVTLRIPHALNDWLDEYV